MHKFDEIDFSRLMDLRIDYAFKLLFGTGDTRYLISLLNAIFANKHITRIVKSITIINPHMERQSDLDKLSVLDIRAQLSDGTSILIEMHMYDLGELKYKTIRSWARAYGEELKAGEAYMTQPPVVCVTFANGAIDMDDEKIHKCCKITDIDDNTIFTDALELHYINMKAFVRSVNNGASLEESLLSNWMAVITEKEIADKSRLREILGKQEEIGMAVAELMRLSEDKYKRQAYLRRQDDVIIYNSKLQLYEQSLKRSQAEVAQAQAEFAQAQAEFEQAEQQIAEKDIIIAELLARLGEK